LTDSRFTKRYWNLSFDTDWKPGSPMVWDNQGTRIEDPEQVVLESDPYTRLSYTWHTFTPELAAATGFTAEQQATLAAEPRSKVTFEIEDQQPMVKLTVMHETADPDGLVLSLVSGGWPQVLAALKTLLETGRAPSESAA
jgi:uncharacterized protein YndB with AHSA1/START domain